MHHHRPSSTLTLKFPYPENIKEEEESGFESGFDTSDSEGDCEFQEKVVGVQLKKQRMDLDGGSGSKMMSAASGGGRGGGGAVPPQFVCKVDKCQADLSGCKQYHKKHRICEYHSKAEVALVDGLKQRFCQQCSRFHELVEFDDTKRSCRRRLEGHNARRRKSSMAAGFEPKKDDCRIDQERGRITMVCPKNHPKIEIL